MKKILLTLLFSFLSIPVFAQQAETIDDYQLYPNNYQILRNQQQQELQELQQINQNQQETNNQLEFQNILQLMQMNNNNDDD